MNAESKLPDFDGMTPKEMRRAWLRWMADQDFTFPGLAYQQAEFIRLSIDMVILNHKYPEAEAWAKKNLELQFAIFKRGWDERRG